MAPRKGPVSLKHVVVAERADDHDIARQLRQASAKLRDEDVPRADRTAGGADMRGGQAGSVTEQPLDADNPQVHRSLYAKRATIRLIREIAFKEEVPAQRLYREGLLLMLQRRGYYKNCDIEDV